MQCDNTQKFQECFNNFTIFADKFLEIEHVQFMSYTCSLLLLLLVEIHQFGAVKTLRRFALLCNIFISYDVNNDNLLSVTNKPFYTNWFLFYTNHCCMDLIIILIVINMWFLVFTCHGWVNIDNSNISIVPSFWYSDGISSVSYLDNL